MFKEQQKISAYFFILALILSATFYLLFLESFKSYTSQIAILFIPKNEKIAVQSEQIAQNLTEFPRNLSFYEKLLADNEDIKDEFVGYSKDKCKKLWNKKLKINREKNSGIIKIEVSDGSQVRSEKIARQTAFTLFNTASRYYNIKKEIDLRIIDGPITSLKVKNWPWLISLSVLVGIFFSYLAMAVLSKIENFLLKAEKGINLTKSRRQGFSSWMPTAWRKDKTGFRKPRPVTAVRKSQAPSNLPVEGETDSLIGKTLTDKSDIIRKKTDTIEEPSEEELKERLNQLLRGEL